MAINNYNISMYQGQSFFLDIDYFDDNGFPVDLRPLIPIPPLISRYVAHMQVRRTGAQFGGNTDNVGIPGVGGISLNYGGVSGAIRLEIDHTTMGYVPAGVQFYDLNVLDRQTNYMDKVITGIVDVQAEVTR